MSDTDERPRPGPKQEPGLDRGPDEQSAGDGSSGDGSSGDGSSAIGSSDVRSAVVEAARQAGYGDGEKDGQDYLDRNDVPYDPAEGLLSGTAITGETEIPGEHENTDAVAPEDAEADSEDATARQG